MFASAGLAFAVLSALASVSALPGSAANSTLQARAARNWRIETYYGPHNLFEEWAFYREDDLNHSWVNYLDAGAADHDGLAFSKPNSFIIRADDKKVVDPNHRGRDSVRIESRKRYDGNFMVVIDVKHIPVGCGVWPAFWTHGNGPWPSGGEIDIIEQNNDKKKNWFTVHTGGECHIPPSGDYTGTLIKGEGDGTNCQRNGCKIASPEESSFGHGLNKAGGGIFIMRRDINNGIAFWHKPRGSLEEWPESVRNSDAGPIDENQLGPKVADFTAGKDGCNPAAFISMQRLVLNIAICGTWAEMGYDCDKGCKDMAFNHPEGYRDAYWEINNIRIYFEE